MGRPKKQHLNDKQPIQESESTNTEVELSSQSEESVLPKSNAYVSDRAIALREIAKRRNTQVAAEGAEPMPPGEDEDLKEPSLEEGAAQAEQLADQEDGEPEKQAEPEKPVEQEEMETIIVEGKTMQVPKSKIFEQGIRALQKETAADYKLQQASALLEEARRSAEAPKKQEQEVSVLDDMTPEQLAERVQYGTKEQATEVFDYLLKKTQPKQQEVPDIASMVKMQLEFQEGQKYLRREYGDIMDDPYLQPVFVHAETRLRQAGDRRSYEDLYKAIGDDIRKHFNRPKPSAEVNTEPAAPTKERTMAQRREDKAKSPAVPNLATMRIEGGDMPKQLTSKEIIERARLARGFGGGKNY